MAGDSVIFNTLERATSGDLNNAQALQTRQLADVLRFATAVQRSGETSPNLFVERDVVIGGLNVTPSGTDVVIGVGALAQYSLSIVPTPGPTDSAERVAVLREPAVLATPVPGSDTFYLLEARMNDVVTVASVVDVFDPGIPGFVPTLEDKRVTRTIEFRFTAGTSTSPPNPALGWVPIAIVFRAAGGPALTATDVRDCRPLADYRVRGSADLSTAHSVEYRRSWIQTTALIPGTNSLLASLDFDVVDPSGDRLWLKSRGAVDLSIFNRSSGLVWPGADNAVRYLYIARAGQVAPSNMYAACAHRGVVFLSDSPPNADNVNASSITLDNGQSVAARSAVCLGMFRSNGTGWYPMTQVGRDVDVWALAASSTSGSLPAIAYDFATPANAKAIDLRVSVTTSGADPGFMWLQLPGGALAVAEAAEVGVVSATGHQTTKWRTRWPRQGGGVVQVRVITATPTSIAANVVGWRF